MAIIIKSAGAGIVRARGDVYTTNKAGEKRKVEGFENTDKLGRAHDLASAKAQREANRQAIRDTNAARTEANKRNRRSREIVESGGHYDFGTGKRVERVDNARNTNKFGSGSFTSGATGGWRSGSEQVKQEVPNVGAQPPAQDTKAFRQRNYEFIQAGLIEPVVSYAKGAAKSSGLLFGVKEGDKTFIDAVTRDKPPAQLTKHYDRVEKSLKVDNALSDSDIQTFAFGSAVLAVPQFGAAGQKLFTNIVAPTIAAYNVQEAVKEPSTRNVALATFSTVPAIPSALKAGRAITFIGKNQITAAAVVEPQVLSGAQRFPSSKTMTPKQLARSFKDNPYNPYGGTGGFHTSDAPVRPTVEAGSSATRGLYIADSLSPHFLRAGSGENPNVKLSIIPKNPRPTAQFIETEVGLIPSGFVSAASKRSSRTGKLAELNKFFYQQESANRATVGIELLALKITQS